MAATLRLPNLRRRDFVINPVSPVNCPDLGRAMARSRAVPGALLGPLRGWICRLDPGARRHQRPSGTAIGPGLFRNGVPLSDSQVACAAGTPQRHPDSARQHLGLSEHSSLSCRPHRGNGGWGGPLGHFGYFPYCNGSNHSVTLKAPDRTVRRRTLWSGLGSSREPAPGPVRSFQSGRPLATPNRPNWIRSFFGRDAAHPPALPGPVDLRSSKRVPAGRSNERRLPLRRVGFPRG